MNTPALRECPFCGGVDIDVETLPRPAEGRPVTAMVSCRSCGTVGPTAHHQSIDQALAAWITRHGDDTLYGSVADECVFHLNL